MQSKINPFRERHHNLVYHWVLWFVVVMPIVGYFYATTRYRCMGENRLLLAPIETGQVLFLFSGIWHFMLAFGNAGFWRDMFLSNRPAPAKDQHGKPWTPAEILSLDDEFDPGVDSSSSRQSKTPAELEAYLLENRETISLQELLLIKKQIQRLPGYEVAVGYCLNWSKQKSKKADKQQAAAAPSDGDEGFSPIHWLRQKAHTLGMG